MLARVPRQPSLQQHDRLPVSTYDEAVWRLVQIRCDQSIDDAGYDAAVQLVADIFWVSDKRVRADALKAARTVGAE